MSTEIKLEKKRQVVYNGVQCLVCGRTIDSTYRHDLKTCGCPNVAMVDGGLDGYMRFGAKEGNQIRKITFYSDDPFEKVRLFAFRLKPDGSPVRLYRMDSEWLDNAIEHLIDLINSKDAIEHWHLILLLKEAQLRRQHESGIYEEESIKEKPKTVKKDSPEEEVIRIPVARFNFGAGR